jgi:hypothetical protein
MCRPSVDLCAAARTIRRNAATQAELFGLRVARGGVVCLLVAAVPAVGAGRVYWTNSGNDTVSFANLDNAGGGGQLTTPGAMPSFPLGVAIRARP